MGTKNTRQAQRNTSLPLTTIPLSTYLNPQCFPSPPAAYSTTPPHPSQRAVASTHSPPCFLRHDACHDTADDEGEILLSFYRFHHRRGREPPHHRAIVSIDIVMRTRSYLRQSSAKPSLESPRPFVSFLSRCRMRGGLRSRAVPRAFSSGEVRSNGQLFARFIEINGGSNSY
jgi:hypothetical protein